MRLYFAVNLVGTGARRPERQASCRCAQAEGAPARSCCLTDPLGITAPTSQEPNQGTSEQRKPGQAASGLRGGTKPRLGGCFYRRKRQRSREHTPRAAQETRLRPVSTGAAQQPLPEPPLCTKHSSQPAPKAVLAHRKAAVSCLRRTGNTRRPGLRPSHFACLSGKIQAQAF